MKQNIGQLFKMIHRHTNSLVAYIRARGKLLKGSGEKPFGNGPRHTLP